MDIRDIISKVFEHRGYEIVSDAELLVAKKGNIKIAIKYKLGKLTVNDIKSFTEMADKKIAISTDAISSRVRTLAESSNISLWDRELLANEVGKLVLADIDNVHSAFAQIFRAKFVVLKKTVLKYDALFLCKKLNKPSAKLELFPYYIYRYECELLEQGRLLTRKETGVGGVNTITKDYEPLSIQFEKETMPGGEKLKPQISKKEGLTIAKAGVIDENTKVIEVRSEKGNVVIYEKRTFSPKEDSTSLNYQGIFYVPIWHCEGKNGSMYVNGVTGKVIKEDIKPSLPDEKIDVV